MHKWACIVAASTIFAPTFGMSFQGSGAVSSDGLQPPLDVHDTEYSVKAGAYPLFASLNALLVYHSTSFGLARKQGPSHYRLRDYLL